MMFTSNDFCGFLVFAISEVAQVATRQVALLPLHMDEEGREENQHRIETSLQYNTNNNYNNNNDRYHMFLA